MMNGKRGAIEYLREVFEVLDLAIVGKLAIRCDEFLKTYTLG